MGFWVSGAAHSISWDYLPHIPQGEAAERKFPWKEKPVGSWFYREVLKRDTIVTSNETRNEQNIEKMHIENDRGMSSCNSQNQLEGQSSGTLKISEALSGTKTESTADVVAMAPETDEALSTPYENPRLGIFRRLFQSLSRLRQVLSVLLSPITIVLIISIPIALVQPLKALFVDTTAQGGPDWKGPDGRPPLFFIIDTGKSFPA